MKHSQILLFRIEARNKQCTIKRSFFFKSVGGRIKLAIGSNTKIQSVAVNIFTG